VDARARPQEGLGQLVEFARRHGFSLIVVNDGSKDKTGEILSRFAENSPCLTLIHHKVNKGYGGALKSGIRAATTPYTITIDADGQHQLEDVVKLYEKIRSSQADMVVGRRSNNSSTLYRRLGKFIIRSIAKALLPIHISDLNSGMKIFKTEVGKKYLDLCPDSMAFSDTITLVCINEKLLVTEQQIEIINRNFGASTISFRTAIDTVIEILNLVALFNPMRIFLPISLLFIGSGILWNIPIFLKGIGLSVGSLLLIISGVLSFCLGLIAEQLSLIRKSKYR
jgi:glycosyltransferase involved in cell wall biosynthesis